MSNDKIFTLCSNDSNEPDLYTNPYNWDRYKAGSSYKYWKTVEEVPLEGTTDKSIDKGEKYYVTMRNRKTGEEIKVDIYDVLEAFNITCSAMAHGLKKFLMAGKRGVKGFNKDCDEGINSVEQSKLLQKYRK